MTIDAKGAERTWERLRVLTGHQVSVIAQKGPWPQSSYAGAADIDSVRLKALRLPRQILRRESRSLRGHFTYVIHKGAGWIFHPWGHVDVQLAT